MTDIVKDISTLTTIPDKTIQKLLQKVVWCICEGVAEDALADVDISEIDVGIGTLWIKHADDDIKYKFIPNEALSKAVSSTVNGKLNSLEKSLSDNLAKKFIDVYKDLC